MIRPASPRANISRGLPQSTELVQHLTQTSVPGIQVAVVADGCEHVLAAGDAAPRKTMTVNSAFPAFCATQPLIAIAALVCAHRKNIKVDVPLGDLLDLDTVIPAAKTVSLLDTIQHRAAFDSPDKLTALVSTSEALRHALLSARPNPSSDGYSAVYSDYVHPFILTHFISQVSGINASDWLAQEIRTSGGLSNTHFTDQNSSTSTSYFDLRQPNAAPNVYYWQTPDGQFNPLMALASQDIQRRLDPAIGGLTTARDLARFYSFVLDSILKRISPADSDWTSAIRFIFDLDKEPPTIDLTTGTVRSYQGPFLTDLDRQMAPTISQFSYGHPGWFGTTFGFCDTDNELALGVLCNALPSSPEMAAGIRSAIINAVYTDLGYPIYRLQ